MSYNFFKINQGEKTEVYIFTLPAKELLKYAKIERVREEDNKKNSKGFQRKLDLKRVSKIRNYLLKENSFIPTNFIVNICTSNHLDTEFQGGANFIGDELILTSQNDILIIDGQHRLAALDYINYNSELNNTDVSFKKLTLADKERLDKYEVILTGYLNASRTDMAKIFILINDNQKKVKKSVIFDLLHISGDKLNNLDQETEEILMTGLTTIEQIRATSVIEELAESKSSYWYNGVNFEGGKMKKVELGSFVEHLSQALGKNRFLNEIRIPFHDQRVKIIDLFYKKLIDTVFLDKLVQTEFGELTQSKYEQFLSNECILSKASGVGIMLSKDILDDILRKSFIDGNISSEILEHIFKGFKEEDFLSSNTLYKGKLSSKAGYSQIITHLKSKIK